MSIKKYESNFDFIKDWQKLIDYSFSYYLEQVLGIKSNTDHKLDKYKGLIITREEMVQLLDNLYLDNDYSKAELQKNIIDYYKIREQILTNIKIRVRESIKTGIFLPFTYIVHRFKLDDFEQFVLMLALLSYIHPDYSKIISYIQEDVSKSHPRVELAIKLFFPDADNSQRISCLQILENKIFQYFIVNNEHDTIQQTLLLDKSIRNFILDEQSIYNNNYDFLELWFPGDSGDQKLYDDLWVQKDVNEDLMKQVEQLKKPLLCNFFSKKAAGKKLQLKLLANKLQQPILFVKSSEALKQQQLMITVREALLHNAIICINKLDESVLKAVKRLLDENVIVATLNNIDDKDLILEQITSELYQVQFNIINCDIPLPTRQERAICWQKLLELQQLALEEDIDVYELANKFLLTPGQIKQAWREVVVSQEITKKKVYDACYRQINHKLKEMASLVDARYKLDDLVIPHDIKAQLTQATYHVRYRHVVLDEWGFAEKLPYGKGISMLFGGPPGTGKTMAAQVVANQLGLEMYKINISQVISKYIGETEKNLQKIFDEAARSNSILFFDECDAIFGKRTEVKDARDRYANIETSYLLQKIEEYEGISVLATNFTSNIDSAFMRRIQYVLYFPFPDVDARLQIWQKIFPKKTPLDENIDLFYLAKTFELSGGNIKNIAVNAAFLAAAEHQKVSMEHIIPAVRQELIKLGKVVVNSDFGEYAFYNVTN